MLNQGETDTACRYLTFYSFSLQMVTLFICCLADIAQVRAPLPLLSQLLTSRSLAGPVLCWARKLRTALPSAAHSASGAVWAVGPAMIDFASTCRS